LKAIRLHYHQIITMLSH